MIWFKTAHRWPISRTYTIDYKLTWRDMHCCYRRTCGAPVTSFWYCGLCGTWSNIVSNSIRRRVFVSTACWKSFRTGCSSFGCCSTCSIVFFTHFWCVS
jgi:hypothetical protein